MIGGLIVSCTLVILSPDVLGGSHVFGLAIPAIVSVPAALLLAIVGSWLGRRGRPLTERPYVEVRRRAFPRVGGARARSATQAGSASRGQEVASPPAAG